MHDLKSPEIQDLLAYRSPVGVALVERSGRFVDANDAYSALVGYSGAELARRDWMSITHPDDLTADRTECDELCTDRASGGYCIVKRYIRKDGRTVWCELTVVPIRDPAGVCTHLLSFAVPLPDAGGGYRVEHTSGSGNVRMRPVVRWADLVRDHPREALLLCGLLVALIRGDNIMTALADYASKLFPH